MQSRPVRHRRARRSDFAAIGALLTASGVPVPAAERAALRHFRHLVADLGGDLYVAESDAHILGLVHVVYARQLFCAPRARLALLIVDPTARGRGIGRGLAAMAADRARRRGCAALRCATPPAGDSAQAFLDHTGWRSAGDEFEFDLAEPAQ